MRCSQPRNASKFAIFSILTGLESGEKISQRCLIFPVMFFELLNFDNYHTMYTTFAQQTAAGGDDVCALTQFLSSVGK